MECYNCATGRKTDGTGIKYSKYHSENFNLILKLLYLKRIYVSVNEMGGSIHVLKENTEALVSRDQNAGRNHSVRINNSTFERVEEFKYLGTSLTHQNSIPEEIKSRLSLGNACYH